MRGQEFVFVRGVKAMDLLHIGIIVLIVAVLIGASWWGNNGKPGLPG
jgi:hypothetical protein